jgi:hypothetical protein
MKKEGGNYKRYYFIATDSGLRYYKQEPVSIEKIWDLDCMNIVFEIQCYPLEAVTRVTASKE